MKRGLGTAIEDTGRDGKQVSDHRGRL